MSRFRVWLQILMPRTLLPVVDLALVNLAVLIALGVLAVSYQLSFGREFLRGHVHWFPVLSVLWLLLATTQDFYRRRIITSASNNLKALAGITASLLIIYFTVYFFLGPKNRLPRGIVVYTAVASFVLVGLWRLAYVTFSPVLPAGLAVHPTTAKSPAQGDQGNQSQFLAEAGSDNSAVHRPEGEPDDEVFTVQEVAEYLKVSQATVWRWCQDGKLPAFRLGQQWRIRAEDLQATIEAEAAPEH